MIYLDHFYYGFHDRACFFENYNEIPPNCDTVGLVFYSMNPDHIHSVIAQVRPRTNRLLITLTEPGTKFLEIVTHYESDPGMVFFGDVVLNHPRSNYYPAISWFLGTRNFYASEPWAVKLLASLDHSDHKPYKFDCLLGAQRIHRDLVESFYQQSSLKDQFFFTYFRKDITQGHWNQDYSQHSLTSEPVEIDVIGNQTYHAALSAIIPDYIYNQTSHTIVCETTCFNEYNQYTEKVAKPMLAQRIFVAFCGQWYLRNLRSLGFRTFDTIIDESYDSDPNMPRRFARAWAQVERLCQADSAQLRSQVRDILEHNRQHFIATDWHKNIRRFLT